MKNIYNNMTLEQYSKFINSSYNGSLITSALNCFNPDSNLQILISGLALAVVVNTSVAWFTNKEQCTKDYIKIEKLYAYFIENYKDLNKIFGFNNPVEIYALYSLLLRDGYLSVDHIYQHNKNNIKDIYGLEGINIINGKGVCRHTSNMLRDILISNNIYTKTLVVNNNDYNLNFTVSESENKEKLNNIINYFKYSLNEKENALLEKILKLSDNKVQLICSEVNKKNITFNIFGNHLVTYAKHNKINYILDPTNFKTYNLKDKSKNILIDAIGLEYPVSLMSNIFDKNATVREYVKDDYQSFNDTFDDINKVKVIYDNNLDTFDYFYKTNKELYEEIIDIFNEIEEPYFKSRK